MAIDPNVQVALVTVIATSITTAGVIIVAIINNRKERVKSAGAGVEAGLDEKNVLERMLSLIADNERKEKTIVKLEAKVKSQAATIANLRAQLRKGQVDEPAEPN